VRLFTIVSLALVLAVCAPCAEAQKGRPLRSPDVHYEPSSPEIVEAMLKLADVTKDDIVYDLGCGDGRIAIAAVQKFGAHGVGRGSRKQTRTRAKPGSPAASSS
jgi:tRNA G10  N-methylase Trm11